jgi:hypothetical protein
MEWGEIDSLAVFVLSSDAQERQNGTADTALQRTPKQGDASMTCERCGGFKVFDYFDGPFHCTGFRCINCGSITDMQISMPVQTRVVIAPKHRPKAARRPLFGTTPTRGAHPGQAEDQP